MGLDIRIKDLQLHHVPGSRINAQFRAGEIVGIAGANGAGKSELLRMIAGILRPKSMGEILIDGLDPFHGRDLEKLHRRIGFAQQSPKDTMVFSRMIQDAPFGPENQATPPEVIRKRWEGLKERLMTGIPEDQPFETLSGGQQQKAALVSVLMLRSKILLLDEPTSMLGRREGREVEKLLLKLAKRSEQTVLLVSHDPEILRQADRVFLLTDGELMQLHKSEVEAALSHIRSEKPKSGADAQATGGSGESGGSGRTTIANPLDQFIYETQSSPRVLSAPTETLTANPSVRWVMMKRPDLATPLIVLKDVSVRFGKKNVVEHFSAAVCPGGYYELTGGIGSGKSTLCKLMNGTLFANSGEVTVGGVRLPMAGQKRKSAFGLFGKKMPGLGEVRRFAGYAMQSPEDQLFETSVIFDVMYGPLRAGRAAMEARQDAESALRELEVPEALWDRRPEHLSAGEQRRVAIAGILAMQPQVLILDEPYAGLDTQGCRIIDKLISDYVNQGRAVVMTRHV